ncbi:M20/M25/M40 family metallo-hydrolase [Pararhodospirillum photometricum]|uniref:M20/M25/M40 family metallo-hydrolase n=1 Tax=Pararhodospirillum photometricum TaxID=1084 RepID=UPI000686AA6F|nr:M20/M25/M40 family metallo-hydrolase [Pararhodospirillum photometricum]
MDVFAGLSPEPVWRHFAQVCAIPHPSHHEDALRQHVKAWAGTRGIGVAEDKAGNLLLTKPASPSRSDRPGVILQAHLDMVGEAVAGSSHDFTRDPIRPQVDQGWVLAPGTTLGADNGIGIALALAALEDDTLVHPPLEVLLTTDEECGMGGARALAPGWLRGRVLLNLDTEAVGGVLCRLCRRLRRRGQRRASHRTGPGGKLAAERGSGRPASPACPSLTPLSE